MAPEPQATLRPERAGTRGGCLGLGCLILAGPAAALGLAWFALGLSGWTASLALGLALLALSCRALASGHPYATRAAGAGLVLVLGPWLFRALALREREGVRITTLPADSGARLVSTLYPEPDGALVAAALLQLSGTLEDDEAGELREILRQAYARTEPAAASFATPAIPTYLGLERPEAFDTVVIGPGPSGSRKPDAAVIFLHGYAGNFYGYCWELAQAASQANLVTLCPSMDASGAWWTQNGERTFRATLDYAHGLGARRVYLAGLSNGAAGASVLSLAHQQDLSGVVLISGGRAETPPAIPVLVVQGTTDRRMPASRARAYASKGPRVTYHEVPGGHFVFLSRYQHIRPVVAGFLRRLEERR